MYIIQYNTMYFICDTRMNVVGMDSSNGEIICPLHLYFQLPVIATFYHTSSGAVTNVLSSRKLHYWSWKLAFRVRTVILFVKVASSCEVLWSGGLYCCLESEITYCGGSKRDSALMSVLKVRHFITSLKAFPVKIYECN